MESLIFHEIQCLDTNAIMLGLQTIATPIQTNVLKSSNQYTTKGFLSFCNDTKVHVAISSGTVGTCGTIVSSTHDMNSYATEQKFWASILTWISYSFHRSFITDFSSCF